MRIEPFALERYFATFEFTARYLLSASDCEGLRLRDLLVLADPEALRLWENLVLGYTESQGHPLLRQEIAGLYQSIAPDDILVAAPEEAIFIAVNALLRPGDHVIAVVPAYQSLYEVAAALGCRITRWNLELRGQAWHLEADFLRDEIRPDTRLIIVNFPHNPTGYLPSQDLLERMVDEARKHGIPVFSDEMYRLLEYDERDRLSSVADLYEHGITMSGLSKAFALPGLRIGWLATRDWSMMKRFAEFKDYTTICNSAPSEILAIIALRAKEVILQRNRRIIRDNLLSARRFFSERAGLFSWIAPVAGSVAFPKLRDDLPVADFCRDVLTRASVMVAPAGLFGYPGNHFRVGLGRVNFSAALEQLQTYLLNTGLF